MKILFIIELYFKKKILLDFFLERMKSGLRARYIQRKYIQQSNEIIIRLNGIRNTRWSLELCENVQRIYIL